LPGVAVDVAHQSQRGAHAPALPPSAPRCLLFESGDPGRAVVPSQMIDVSRLQSFLQLREIRWEILRRKTLCISAAQVPRR
jgi:hypothetical protein